MRTVRTPTIVLILQVANSMASSTGRPGAVAVAEKKLERAKGYGRSL